MTPRRATVTLAATASSPGLARRFVADTLRTWTADGLVERAELVVSELVTNAIRHARGESRIVVSDEGPSVRIVVADVGDGGVVVRQPQLSDVGGRGLVLVEALADRWGASHEGPEHVVWCEIAK
jgi:anti-sigma regulatory factor (Ser/Thr protein kinase)